MHEELRRQVLQLYTDVDRKVAEAGPVCVASGRCCRFKEYGHVLFLSSIEAEILLDGAPAFERPISTAGCPYQQGTLCTARASRPLGCRIYFCDLAYQETAHRITEDALGRLKELATAHAEDWRYAPLHHFLNQAAETTS